MELGGLQAGAAVVASGRPQGPGAAAPAGRFVTVEAAPDELGPSLLVLLDASCLAVPVTYQGQDLVLAVPAAARLAGAVGPVEVPLASGDGWDADPDQVLRSAT
eukprot:10065804-Lingulodinium_polyedra.AAC.1